MIPLKETPILLCENAFMCCSLLVFSGVDRYLYLCFRPCFEMRCDLLCYSKGGVNLTMEARQYDCNLGYAVGLDMHDVIFRRKL